MVPIMRAVPGMRATFAMTEGVIIREIHKAGQDRRITHVDDDPKGYVTCTGVVSGRTTRIKKKNLGRYVVA